MAVFTYIPPDEIQRVARAFGLGQARAIRGIARGTVNTIYRFTTHRDTFFLRLDEVSNPRALAAEIELLTTINCYSDRLSFRIPQPVVTPKNPRPILSIAGKQAVFFPQIPGKDLGYEQLNHQHLINVGRALGELHNLPVTKGLRPHRFGRLLLAQKLKRVAPLLKKKSVRDWKILKNLWQKTKTSLRHQERSIIHGDLFPENVHFRGTRLVGILDLEAAGVGHPLFDLATTFNAMAYAHGHYDHDRCRAILAGYLQKRSCGQNLWDDLELFLLQSDLRFTLTRLVDFEFAPGKIPKPFRDYRDYLDRVPQAQQLSLFLKKSL